MLLTAEGVLAGSGMRCSGRLVTTPDTTIDETLSRCGEPVSRERLGYKEVVDYYGYRSEVMVEEWIYGPRNGMYYFLRFEGGRLVKVDSRRGQ
jgi:hypothetical protein